LLWNRLIFKGQSKIEKSLPHPHKKEKRGSYGINNKRINKKGLDENSDLFWFGVLKRRNDL